MDLGYLVSSFPSICLIYSQQCSGSGFGKLQDADVEYFIFSAGAVLWIWVALLHEKALQGLWGEEASFITSVYLKKLLPIIEIFLKLHLALFLSLIPFILSAITSFLISLVLLFEKLQDIWGNGFFWKFPYWLLLNKKKYEGDTGVIGNWGNCLPFALVSPPYIKWNFWDKIKSSG